MSYYVRTVLAIALAGCIPITQAFADDSKDKPPAKSRKSKAAAATTHVSANGEIREVNLLDAARPR